MLLKSPYLFFILILFSLVHLKDAYGQSNISIPSLSQVLNDSKKDTFKISPEITIILTGKENEWYIREYKNENQLFFEGVFDPSISRKNIVLFFVSKDNRKYVEQRQKLEKQLRRSNSTFQGKGIEYQSNKTIHWLYAQNSSGKIISKIEQVIDLTGKKLLSNGKGKFVERKENGIYHEIYIDSLFHSSYLLENHTNETIYYEEGKLQSVKSPLKSTIHNYYSGQIHKLNLNIFKKYSIDKELNFTTSQRYDGKSFSFIAKIDSKGRLTQFSAIDGSSFSRRILKELSKLPSCIPSQIGSQSVASYHRFDLEYSLLKSGFKNKIDSLIVTLSKNSTGYFELKLMSENPFVKYIDLNPFTLKEDSAALVSIGWMGHNIHTEFIDSKKIQRYYLTKSFNICFRGNNTQWVDETWLDFLPKNFRLISKKIDLQTNTFHNRNKQFSSFKPPSPELIIFDFPKYAAGGENINITLIGVNNDKIQGIKLKKTLDKSIQLIHTSNKTSISGSDSIYQVSFKISFLNKGRHRIDETWFENIPEGFKIISKSISIL